MHNPKISESATIRTVAARNMNDVFCEGDLLFWRCEYGKAREYFQEILNEQAISSENLARCYNSLGAANAKLQNYEKAITNYHSRLDVLMKSEISTRKEGDIAECYMSIGMIYWLQHDYTRALYCHEQALEALPTPELSPDLISNIYKNLANLYTKKKTLRWHCSTF